MTEYVVLLPGDEAAWQSRSPEEQAVVYQRHMEFAKRLEERGHRVTGGAELTPSTAAKTVRGAGETFTVTDGPYAETAEQLTGFYTIESNDLDDLVEVVGFLAGAEGAIEVRACKDMSESGSA